MKGLHAKRAKIVGKSLAKIEEKRDVFPTGNLDFA
jgi:hypothetical protein